MSKCQDVTLSECAMWREYRDLDTHARETTHAYNPQRRREAPTRSRTRLWKHRGAGKKEDCCFRNLARVYITSAVVTFALCSFVCPSKIDVGSVIRHGLNLMKEDG